MSRLSHARLFSRCIPPELFKASSPSERSRAREARELASPMARLQQKTQAAGTTGSAEGIPTFPARWCYDLYALFPGTGCLAPVACDDALASSQTWHQLRDARTTRLHRRTGSFVRTRHSRCDPTRPPHPAPDVRDARDAPPRRAGMR